MSRRFLLNLANRSASRATVPLARPYLRPVFMPPAPTLPIAEKPSALPSSQGQVQTTQESRSSRLRTLPERPSADSSWRSEPYQSAPSARPSTPAPTPMPARPAQTEQAMLPPAEPSPMPASPAQTEQAMLPLAEPSPMPARPAQTEQAMLPPAEPSPMPASPAQTEQAMLPPAEPSPMPARPAQTEQAMLPPAEPSPMLARPALTEQLASAPADPTPDPRDGSPHPMRERVSPQQPQQPAGVTRSPRARSEDSDEIATSPRPSKPAHREPVLHKGHHSQAQSASQPGVTAGENKPSAIQPAMTDPFVPHRPEVPVAAAVIERIVAPEPRQPQQPQMPQAAMPKPQMPSLAAAPAPIVAETIRERLVPVNSDVAQTSSRRKPQVGHPTTLQALPLTTILERSTTAEAATRRVQTALPATSRVERVAPAPEQHPPLQPQRAQGSNTPPIQVSIGTIDLRVNPPEPSKIQSPYRRRRPQGFDGFQIRRSYSGWED
jgi:hypothetical protein